MDFIPEEEGPAVSEAAHAVIRDAKDAGVWVFAGGLYSHDEVNPRVVGPDGTVTDGNRFAGCSARSGGFPDPISS
jgi:hypothetical protein